MRPISPAPPGVASPLSQQLFRELSERCRDPNLLAHLYWKENYRHFERSRDAHLRGAAWRLKATPYHGVGKLERPTLNFLAANTEWVDRYAKAAEQREFHHGLLLRRAALAALEDKTRYELVDVEPKYPGTEVDRREYWRYDIGRQRFAALDDMARCQVVRFATPLDEHARFIDLAVEDIIAWW